MLPIPSNGLRHLRKSPRQDWLDRAISGLGDPETAMRRWWGRDDWTKLVQKPAQERGHFLAARFRSELGYRYACAYPIFDKDGPEAKKVMFWMVHASDHEEAPTLMVRAYNNAVRPLEPISQLEWEFGGTGV